MTTHRLIVTSALLAIVGVVAYRVGKARADGVPSPTPLSYGGVLDDGGRPVEGMRSVTVRLWDAATGGTATCTTVSPTTPFSAGHFRVTLDEACAVAARANANLWVEVIVDATTFPRSKLGAVPYALEAGRAAAASGALATRISTIETAARPRQVEIGSLGSSPSGCSTTFQSNSALTPLTVTATTSGTYRVSTMVNYNVGGVGSLTLRIGAATSLTYLSRPEIRLYGMGQYAVPVTALVLLDAGRTYTFSLEAMTATAGSCGSLFTGLVPLTVEQLN